MKVNQKVFKLYSQRSTFRKKTDISINIFFSQSYDCKTPKRHLDSMWSSARCTHVRDTEKSNLLTFPKQTSLQLVSGEETLCLTAPHHQFRRTRYLSVQSRVAEIVPVAYPASNIFCRNAKRIRQTLTAVRISWLALHKLTYSSQSTFYRHVGAVSLSLARCRPASSPPPLCQTPSLTPSVFGEMTAFACLVAGVGFRPSSKKCGKQTNLYCLRTTELVGRKNERMSGCHSCNRWPSSVNGTLLTKKSRWAERVG